MSVLLLDAGVLVDLERRPRGESFRRCVAAFESGSRPLLPAVVLAQVWRGSPRQHPLGRIRRMCRVLPFTDDTADDVGRLLALSGTSDVVDAAVVVEALHADAIVLTSDPGDVGKLADALGYPLRVLTV